MHWLFLLLAFAAMALALLTTSMPVLVGCLV